MSKPIEEMDWLNRTMIHLLDWAFQHPYSFLIIVIAIIGFISAVLYEIDTYFIQKRKK